MDEKKIAVIRVRGDIGVNKKIKDTLKMLRLYRKNYCVVLPYNPSYLGMVKKIKDYVTYGIINKEVYDLLIKERGEEYKGRETDDKGKINYKKFININGKKIKPFFRLNPPQKGFGRKGIKKPFSIGGALGDRKEKINDLIMRMV
jgi:large subunit ribosomal protein L30